MTETSAKVLDGEPSSLHLMLKAALPAIPGVSGLPGIKKSGSTLPDLTLTRQDVTVDRDRVAAYNNVCGFSIKDSLPITYPHMLAFGLHMSIMTDGSFPFPAIGTVHLGNSITQHRAISASERLDISAHAENLRAHPKGRVFDLVSTAHADGELVWEETSTFLRRGHGDPGAAEPGPTFQEVAPSGVQWRLPGDLGRSYAAVSGDRNPIHLYGLTAKAFGFPRQIAHGMWSKARCLAALEGRLPDAVTVDVLFKKPILLPGTVAFGSTERGRAGRNHDWAFSLSNPKNGAPHLLGRTTAL